MSVRRVHRNISAKPFSIRRSERKNRNRLIFTTLTIILIFIAAVFWLIPALIGGLSFLNTFKDTPKKEISVSDTVALAPPVLNIPFEATNSSEITIRGYAQPEKQVEIYLSSDLADTVDVLEDGSFTSKKLDLYVGNNAFYGKTTDKNGNSSLSSKEIIIIYDNETPKLDLSSPEDNQTINTERRLKVTGSVEEDDEVSVYVNNLRAIVSSDNTFSQTIELSDGENQVVVSVIDKAGNKTEVIRKVIFQP